MDILCNFWWMLGLLALCVTLPGTLELLALTLAGVWPARRAKPSDAAPWRVAVVVPAHNEARNIAACVHSLREAAAYNDASAENAVIVVVADNCSDNTAARAAASGAQVLERYSADERGKGYALDYAFRRLLPAGYDALLIVDADTTVAPNFIAESVRWLRGGADAVQCRYVVRNPDATARTRLLNVALMAFNVLRPRGRARLGLSCGIYGNGFGLRAATLRTVPYQAASVVEDLEYHLRLVDKGLRVAFADGTSVYGEMPAQGPGAATQRARWEGGRMLMLREWGPSLLGAVLRGRGPLLEPLLDLLLLPLAFHAGLLLLATVQRGGWVRGAAWASLAVLAAHVAAALRVGRGGWREVSALAFAPVYLLWKLTLFKALAHSAQRGAAWVRTARE